MPPALRAMSSLLQHSETRAIGYSAGNLGKNILWSSADLTLLFILTDILDLAPQWAGSVMMVALVADIIIDLCAGRISAYAARHGIAHHHILLALAPFCALSFAALYGWAGADHPDALRVGLALIAFRLFYGLIDVPHNAMLSAIAPDSRSRSRVAGYRFFFSSVATLIVTALLSPQVSKAAITGNHHALASFGMGAAAIAVVALWVAALARRRMPSPPRSTQRIPILPDFDRDYVRLLLLGLLAGGASAMFARSMLYYAAHCLSGSQQAPAILSTLVIGQFAGVGLWSLASQRFETRQALAAANGLSSLFVLGFALVPSGWAQLAMAGATGFAMAGLFSLPWAIMADVIDAKHARFGRRNEPQSVSLFIVSLKGGAALSMGLTGMALAAAGYHGPTYQSPAITTTVAALTILPAAVGGLLAARLAWGMRVSHATQAAHSEALQERSTETE